RPLVLVHSGLLYRSERNPEPFFQALAALRCAGELDPANIRIVLRASGDEAYYESRLHELGIEDVVSLEPPVPYPQALQEMLRADGLLVFQAANCNHQIPAKLYEYFRARKPILAIADPAGNTALLLRRLGFDSIAAIDDPGDIRGALARFMVQITN